MNKPAVMKSFIVTLGFIALAVNGNAQKIIPKSFLDIVKENKFQLQTPLVIVPPQKITIKLPVIISPTDHMPCVVAGAEFAAPMPVLKMELREYSMPNTFPVEK